LVVRKREITDEDFIPLEPLNEEDFLLIEREESST